MSQTNQEHTYTLLHHSHGDHSHFNLQRKKPHGHQHDHGHDHHHHHDHDHDNCSPCEAEHGHATIGRNNEGCPCCANAIDLDEVATALNEINSNSGAGHGHALAELADFSSPAHWGIFLGIAGPLSLIGLTAAYRNIEGTLNNKSKLDTVLKGLDEDIERYQLQRDDTSGEDHEKLAGVVQRLEAFRETLQYSEFDTKFNLAVPGVINGAASTAVLSTAVLTSPAALPIIALYAGCQTVRNSYDLWRTWNKILPEDLRENVELNMDVGIRKINQITDSKRKFYASNGLGFAAFAAGATMTGLAATSLIGAAGMLIGLPLLAAGAVATGITNNIWTNKFKPRNGDLGVERTKLDLDSTAQEIGERRTFKKILKNYRQEHLPDKKLRRFGASLLSSMPFFSEKGAIMLHKANQSRVDESDSSDLDKLDLLERMTNAKILLQKTGDRKEPDALLHKIVDGKKTTKAEKSRFELVTLNKKPPVLEKIFASCVDLKIDIMVLDRFITNAILKPSREHDTSIKTREDYVGKLTKTGLFKIHDNEVTFDLKALERNKTFKKELMNALEECLLFDYVEKLKYEQYGLNDFYWALEKQNQKNPLPSQPRIKDNTDHKHSHGHDHSHSHEHSHDHHHEHKHHHTDHAALCLPIQNEPSSHGTADVLPVMQADADECAAPTEDQQKNLHAWQSLTNKNISHNQQERHQQISEQNQSIDKMLDKSCDFILASKVKNDEANQTVFTYLDPDHVNPDDPDYEAKKMVYVRDDTTGKINVLYGQKAQALVIERPNWGKNGTITQISGDNIQHYGKVIEQSMESFLPLAMPENASPNTNITQTAYSNISKTNESQITCF